MALAQHMRRLSIGYLPCKLTYHALMASEAADEVVKLGFGFYVPGLRIVTPLQCVPSLVSTSAQQEATASGY